jgi:myosin heavy subunit
VRYTVDGFVEKNMETLSNELRYLGDSSSSKVAMTVYQCAGVAGGSDAARATIRGGKYHLVDASVSFKLNRLHLLFF